MKSIRNLAAILIMVFCLPTAGYCDATGEAKPQSDTQYLLNAYSALADDYFSHVVRELRLLAATGEVKSGKWESMKGLVAVFGKGDIGAAAVWYALPDGSYYTTTDGPTGKSLADRTYFPGLIAGKEVMGELVISRSTGMRAAVFAVPIVRDGKVTGAVGVSLAVDEVSRRLNQALGLPPEFVFYALDSKGRVSLHEKPELLFVYPSDLGSDTLNDAIKTMMSDNQGVVSYEFQGRKTVYFRKSPLTGWVYALGLITEPALNEAK